MPMPEDLSLSRQEYSPEWCTCQSFHAKQLPFCVEVFSIAQSLSLFCVYPVAEGSAKSMITPFGSSTRFEILHSQTETACSAKHQVGLRRSSVVAKPSYLVALDLLSIDNIF